jgi:hypothetical protein
MSEPSRSITDLIGVGETAKTVRSFKDSIAEFIGGALEPYQIRRVAKAEADAKRTLARAEADALIEAAKTDVKITTMQRRAAVRLLAEETRKQEHIESVASQAELLLTDKAAPEKMDRDWLENFFDKVRLVSDDEMQKLWAHILAGEANSPGSFSKRAVNLVASLDQKEAESFATLCRFSFDLGQNVPLKNPDGSTTIVVRPNYMLVVRDTGTPVYKDNGITFDALTALESIGLIRLDRDGFRMDTSRNQFSLRYFDQRVVFEYKGDHRSFPVGVAMFTPAAKELARICKLRPVTGFLEYATKQWESEGFKVQVVADRPIAGSSFICSGT